MKFPLIPVKRELISVLEFIGIGTDDIDAHPFLPFIVKNNAINRFAIHILNEQVPMFLRTQIGSIIRCAHVGMLMYSEDDITYLYVLANKCSRKYKNIHLFFYVKNNKTNLKVTALCKSR